MAHRVIVKGAQPPAQLGLGTPYRLEISTFVKDDNIRQFSLYVQALQIYYDRDRKDVTSHWQIGGIHGMPYVDWNGTPSHGRGYCAHGTDLFPTWHRPYIALFEQEIQQIARDLAATYTHDHQIWELAAKDLRQPYWGWDNPDTMVPPPQVTTQTEVQIIKADSRKVVNVPNPFYTYTYPARANSVFYYPFNVWPCTVRHPDASGNSQPDKLCKTLSAIAYKTKDDFDMLFALRTWHEFRYGGHGTSGLESIHNSIHLHSGGTNGNMTEVPVAAFDPIFYLHHAQVDRVISIWHRYNRRTWIEDTADLLPFLKTQTDYWKSPDIINTSLTFNYGYDLWLTAAQSESSEGASEDNQNIALRDTKFKWTVRVECKQYEVRGSFSVYIFLSNEVPANHHAEWLFHPTLAGTFDVFSNPNPDECANCTARADEIIKGFVHINRTYLERSKSETLDPEVVVPYLKEHISWAVIKSNGEVVDIETFPSLKVSVIRTPLIHAEGEQFPTMGQPEIYPEITRGRAGGHRED